MNSKHLRSGLLALLALSAPAAAQTQHKGPDADVYQPVSQALSSKGELQRFDADWTADGRLAMAYVEDAGLNPGLKVERDRLVLALREPGQGTRVLGVFDTLSWRILHVSLAVPDVTFGSTALDRVFVAITAEAGVFGSNGAQKVRAVRLVSVPLDSSNGKLTIISPPNRSVGVAVDWFAALPNAEVNVGRLPASISAYVVDLAFVDPYNMYEFGGDVMLSRSFDAGKTLQEAFYVTGPDSLAAASNPQSPLAVSLYANPTLAFDDSGLDTVLAFEDVSNKVVHLITGTPTTKSFTLEFSTPKGDNRAERAPRVATLEGRVNFTCLGGEPYKGARPLLWFTGVLGVPSGYQELPALHPKALSRGDLEVKGSKGWISVIGLDDLSAPRAHWIEADRVTALGGKAVEVVDDDLTANASSDLAVGLACSALSPEGAAAGRKTPLFMIKNISGSPLKTVRMDP